jgi:hypothetical protein
MRGRPPILNECESALLMTSFPVKKARTQPPSIGATTQNDHLLIYASTSYHGCKSPNNEDTSFYRKIDTIRNSIANIVVGVEYYCEIQSKAIVLSQSVAASGFLKT